MLRSPFMGSLIWSRLALERYSEADLDVTAQGVRDRAAALTVSRQALELGLVDAGDAATHREVDAGDGEAAALDRPELAGGVDGDLLRHVPRLGQRVRERHRVAGSVGRGDQLFGTGLRVGPVRARRPRHGLLGERAAGDADRAGAARQVALPEGARSRFGHVRSPPVRLSRTIPATLVPVLWPHAGGARAAVGDDGAAAGRTP